MKLKNSSLSFVLLISAFLGLSQERPIVNSLSTYSAAAGTTITITGANFVANSQVNFGPGKANFTFVSSTLLEVIVPNTATYAPVTITNLANGLKGSSSRSFILSYGGSTLDVTKINSQYVLVEDGDGSGEKLVWDVCLCDLDLDGDLDAATTHKDTEGLNILRNNSTTITTTFSAPFSVGISNPIKVGADKSNIALCEDLDGDGKSDLIVSAVGSLVYNIKVYANNSTVGSISIAQKQSIQLEKFDNNGTATNRTVDRIFLSDIDGDGKKDLIVGVTNNPTVFIYLNNSTQGNISFNTTSPFKIEITGIVGLDYVASGRLNNDDLPDLVIASLEVADFFIYENKSSIGNIKFGKQVMIADKTDRENIRLADFDNDGLDDFAHVSRTNSTLAVYRNTTTGSTISMSKVFTSSFTSTVGLDVGDLNGDGKIDIAATSLANGIRLYKNTSTSGTISFDSPLAISLNKKPDGITQKTARNIKIADINGDAKPDLVFAFNSTTNEKGEFSVITNRNCIAPSISPTSLTFCYDNAITLNAPESPGSTYAWSTNIPAATFDNNTAKTVKLTIPTGSPSSVQVSLTVTSADGGCVDVATANYSLTGGSVPTSPTINISATTICNGDDFNLSTPFTGGNYLWTRPDGTEAVTSTLNVTGAKASDVGLYTLRVQASGGCYSNVASLLVDIDIPPVLEIYNNNLSDDFCIGETIQLSIPSLSAFTQEWFKDNVTTGNKTTSLNVTTTGLYRVDLISNANGCISQSENYSVRAIAAPTAMITADNAICVGVALDFKAESTGASGFAMTHSWDFKDGTAIQKGVDISHTFNTAGTYLVELSSEYDNIKLCDDIITLSVVVSEVPKITPTAPGRSFETDGKTVLKCPSDSVRLELPKNFKSYLWSNGSTESFTYGKTKANGDPQDITANVITNIGCTLTTEIISIANFSGSGIEITPSQFSIVNNEINLDANTRSISLTASTIGGSNYKWRTKDKIILSDTANATTTVTPREGETILTVLADDTNGCNESRTIKIIKPGLQARKAFSPDGDGINDCWEIVNSESETSCTIYIFDSKGSEIYQAPAPFIANCVWNGKLNGTGGSAPAGIYYFVLKCDDKSSGLTGTILLAK
jgi:gliding motility-associated-like protein